ncbi:DUF2652 domain-containing protein [uncultured Winogradskyella sp.]|uniref:DUF2652 domain-containing protein n=1 Tax=Winogradskyella sp. 4-2091 TaxID=3381659 RepID=UPI00260D9C6F|nr:DUF2652 domain-containing protein [uncultured Winogradskyella sp.]
MSETDNELNSKVIPSLLNEIIYSNEIGLRVSEIEGDAVLFYKRGELPKLKDLIRQCKYFYTQFYKQLRKLEIKHQHKSGSKSIPKTLGLKIILHYSEEIDSVQIGKHIKLIGEDVIVAHRLLKNDIKTDEYLLFSSNLLDEYNTKDLDSKLYWDDIKKGKDVYEHIGEIKYTYIDLTTLLDT